MMKVDQSDCCRLAVLVDARERDESFWCVVALREMSPPRGQVNDTRKNNERRIGFFSNKI